MSPNKLTFGPPGAEWTYDRSTKTYDLTRGINSTSSSTVPAAAAAAQHTRALRIALPAGGPAPAGATLVVDAARTALVVVDMQNFFLHPSCRAHAAGLAAVGPLRATIAACRRVGVRVVWLNWGLTEGDLRGLPAGVVHGFARAMVTAGDGDDEEEDEEIAVVKKVRESGLGVDLGEGKGRCLVAGEWNSEVYAPLAEGGTARAEEDVWCAKNRMSGLWSEGQPLWRYLSGEGAGGEGEGKRTLLFAGVNTDQCVLGTLADAYNAGWDCVMVEDCCATTTEGAREVCLSNVGVSLACSLFLLFSSSLFFFFLFLHIALMRVWYLFDGRVSSHLCVVCLWDLSKGSFLFAFPRPLGYRPFGPSALFTGQKIVRPSSA